MTFFNAFLLTWFVATAVLVAAILYVNRSGQK